MVDNGKESPLQVGLILWTTLWSMLKKLTALKESENRFNQITLFIEWTHALLHNSFFLEAVKAHLYYITNLYFVSHATLVS